MARKGWFWVIPLVALSSLAICLAALGLTHPRPPPSVKVFDGAYAVYKAEMQFFAAVTAYIDLRVVSYNETHALVRYSMNVWGNAREGLVTADRRRPLLPPELENPVLRNEETEYIDELGVRSCLVYVSRLKDGDVVVYIDKETMWPLKIVLDYGFYSVTLRLVEGNVLQTP